MMVPLLVLLLVVQFGDWWSTRRILALGGYERNPLIRWLMGKLGVDLALAAKTAFVMAIGYSLTFLPIYLLAALCGAYGAIVRNNWRVLQRLKSNH